MYCCNLNIEATEAMPTMGFAGPALTRRPGKWKVWCVALVGSLSGPHCQQVLSVMACEEVRITFCSSCPCELVMFSFHGFLLAPDSSARLLHGHACRGAALDSFPP